MLDDRFVKMCSKAEEIQRVWQPKIGDIVIDKTLKYYKEQGFEVIHREMFIENIIGKIEYSEIWCDGDLWIPTQQDLQDLCLVNGELQNITEYVEEFYKFCKEQHKLVTFYNNSWEKLWLLFLMKNTWNKEWNFQREEWVEIKDLEE